MTERAGDAVAAIAVIDATATELVDERPPVDHHPAHDVVAVLQHRQGATDVRATAPFSRTRYTRIGGNLC